MDKTPTKTPVQDNTKDDDIQGKPLGIKAGLDGCNHAFDAEQTRNEGSDDEPCNDGVN